MEELIKKNGKNVILMTYSLMKGRKKIFNSSIKMRTGPINYTGFTRHWCTIYQYFMKDIGKLTKIILQLQNISKFFIEKKIFVLIMKIEHNKLAF